MNKLLVLSLLLSFNVWGQATTPAGIPLNSDWKVQLNDFAVKNLIHQSWGYSHSERNYLNTIRLAHLENVVIDEEVLFAAAFMHDLGGMAAFEIEGTDHGVRSVEVGVPLLLKMGFPASKIQAVKDIIIGHIYYGPMPTDPVARLFRDADILDFTGAMGIARIIAATPEMGKYPTIKNSYDTLQAFMKKMPAELHYKTSKIEVNKRLIEMKVFLKQLKAYSFGEKAF